METATTIKSNQQFIQQAIDDFLRGDIPAVINACSDDVKWGSYDNPDTPFAGMYEGKKGVQDFFTKLAENVNYSKFEYREFISQGDSVIVLGHHTGTVKSTGKTFDHDWCFHFRVQNQKLAYFFAYIDSRDQSQSFQ